MKYENESISGGEEKRGRNLISVILGLKFSICWVCSPEFRKREVYLLIHMEFFEEENRIEGWMKYS